MEAGEVLDGRYRVKEALDQGGMGTIWTATDLESGQVVAVKVLRLDAYTQGWFAPAERTRHRIELLKRFEREGVILEALPFTRGRSRIPRTSPTRKSGSCRSTRRRRVRSTATATATTKRTPSRAQG